MHSTWWLSESGWAPRDTYELQGCVSASTVALWSWFSFELEIFHISMRRYWDWTVVTCRGVLEQTPVGPAAPFVEPPGSRIPRHHCEPGTRVPGISDPSFCARHERVGHAFATMKRRNVDLFDFVVGDHHESGDLALDYGDRGVIHSLRSPRPERIFVTRLDQLLGDEPEVAVAPSEMPDLSDRRRVFR